MASKEQHGGEPAKKVRKKDVHDTVGSPQAGDELGLLSDPVRLQCADGTLQEKFVAASPFPHLQLLHFLKDEDFCRELREEVLRHDFHKKSNDLYEFYQTDELNVAEKEGAGSSEKSKLQQVRDLFTCQAFRDWLCKATGVEELSSTVDMFGAIYNDGGYLLCHDDRLQGRRIAYILYLVPEDWNEGDGGQLDLMSVERDGVPSLEQPATSLVPAWNSFALFPVTVNSFHQVREVTGVKPRLTISGWFHGPPPYRPPVAPVTPYLSFSPTEKANVDLAAWVNARYLDPSVQKQIQEQFESESNINLEDFLLPERFHSVRASLDNLTWLERGPPVHRRHFGADDVSTTGESLVALELLRVMRSAEFAGLLTVLTDIPLAVVKGEVRKFERSCYTLMYDDDPDRLTEGVDCILQLFPPALSQAQPQDKEKTPAAKGDGKKDVEAEDREIQGGDEWEEEWGGYMSYNDEEGELISVWPAANVLSLVFRVKGNSRFVKYLSHKAATTRHDVMCAFMEAPEEEST